MLKNRDTDSNPYRVPPQPTPMWVKVSIPVLTFLLLGTMGVVAYLGKWFHFKSIRMLRVFVASASAEGGKEGRGPLEFLYMMPLMCFPTSTHFVKHPNSHQLS